MEQQKARTSRDINAVHAKAFSEMTFWEKLVHLGKVFVFLLTFGFAFPHILSE